MTMYFDKCDRNDLKTYMDKKKLIAEFIKLIESDLALAIQAQKTTVEYATGEENKAENQYDTRGLEATYLARGQAERVADLRESLAFFKTTAVKAYTDESAIGNSALIEIVNTENEKDMKTLLLMPKGGGLSLTFQGQAIQVVTATSPLGQAILGKYVGDDVVYTSGDKTWQYEIITVK